MVPLLIPWLLSHLLMEPCLQGSLISFKVGVKSLVNFSTDRPVSHPRYASAPGSKLSWRSPNTEGNPEKNKQLQAGNAPVDDEIPPKIFKEGGEVITVKLTELMQQFWVKGSVPRDFKDANATIPPVQEQRWQSILWQPQYKGISLLSIQGKIMARIILSCITHHLLDDFRLRESVCLQEKQRDNRHDIPRRKDQGKVLRAESELVHPLCDQGLWYGLLVGWTCGLNGRHALPENGLLLWGRQRCT